jgi:hypothetical protein
MNQIVKLVLCSALLSSASTSLAQERPVVPIEDWCWDRDFDGDNEFECNVDGRLMGTLYDYPIPEFDINDPAAWPTVIRNYGASKYVLPEDTQRCVNFVRTQTKWIGVPAEDIFVTCVANVTFVAPHGVASGTRNFAFEHPIELGREKWDADAKGWHGILADVNSIACGCYLFADGTEID